MHLYFSLRWLLHVSAKQCHPQGASMFLSEPLQCQYGRRQVIGHTFDGTYIPTCYIATCFGKTMPSSGASMFLSEPLQCQYGRRQVIGHTFDGTYIPTCYIATCFGKTMPSS